MLGKFFCKRFQCSQVLLHIVSFSLNLGPCRCWLNPHFQFFVCLCWLLTERDISVLHQRGWGSFIFGTVRTWWWNKIVVLCNLVRCQFHSPRKCWLDLDWISIYGQILGIGTFFYRPVFQFAQKVVSYRFYKECNKDLKSCLYWLCLPSFGQSSQAYFSCGVILGGCTGYPHSPFLVFDNFCFVNILFFEYLNCILLLYNVSLLKCIWMFFHI